MTRNITARDLMLHDVAGIDADKSLGEAMQKLVDLQADAEIPNALVVLDEHGHYEGVLTARLLCRSLLTLWMPGETAHRDEAALEKELLEVVRERSRLRVHDTLTRGLPTAAPNDRLLLLIDMACDRHMEFIPVVDRGKVLGLVPVTQIFQSAASLALTPEHEGIRFDPEAPK